MAVNENKEFLVNLEHPEHKYYTRVPNMLDDDGRLTPTEFRLYVHLKRVAGEEGRCFQTTRTLAQKTNMSLGSVVRAKRNLTKYGYIRLEKQVRNSTVRDVIIIADIWQENVSAYRNKGSNSATCSNNEHTRSIAKLAKKNPVKKNLPDTSYLAQSPVPQAPEDDKNPFAVTKESKSPSGTPDLSSTKRRWEFIAAAENGRKHIALAVVLSHLFPEEKLPSPGGGCKCPHIGRLGKIAQAHGWRGVFEEMERARVDVDLGTAMPGDILSWVEGRLKNGGEGRQFREPGRRPRIDGSRPASDFTGDW
jgi:hypothetical protein